MAAKDNSQQRPDRSPRQPVFSERIDELIRCIWELGGKNELLVQIERLKRLPEDEFVAQLERILAKLEERKSE